MWPSLEPSDMCHKCICRKAWEISHLRKKHVDQVIEKDRAGTQGRKSEYCLWESPSVARSKSAQRERSERVIWTDEAWRNCDCVYHFPEYTNKHSRRWSDSRLQQKRSVLLTIAPCLLTGPAVGHTDNMDHGLQSPMLRFCHKLNKAGV